MCTPLGLYSLPGLYTPFSSNNSAFFTYPNMTSIQSTAVDLNEPGDVIELEDTSNIYDPFEASNIYNIGNAIYFLILEATGTDGFRCFH